MSERGQISTMSPHSATAVASPNIAFIKYWGNRDHKRRLPANSSLSMTLSGLETRTSVTFLDDYQCDRLLLNGVETSGEPLERVSSCLDHLRQRANVQTFALIESVNNFPAGAGIASSASAFAALTYAGASALGLDLNPRELSQYARRGSGSASRSMFGGYVIWHCGHSSDDSFAEQLVPPDHWDLVDLIAVVSEDHKSTGSSRGHMLADTSPLQASRVADTQRRIEICKNAILSRDFESLASIIELDSNLMHAVMLTSTPPLFYWQPATIEIIHTINTLRGEGIEVCYTIDAGPNVHCLCVAESVQDVKERIAALPGVINIIESHPGFGPHILDIAPAM
jgi:diphosphomevalonate decarboxylase